MSHEGNSEGGIKRPLKNLTSLSLNWIADKFRKKEEIKQKILDGDYSVDSQQLAKSIVDSE